MGNIVLSDELEEKRLNYLFELNNEINELTNTINNINDSKEKKEKIMKLKKLRKKIQIALPIFVTNLGLCGLFSLIGMTPFHIDNEKHYLSTQINLQSDGGKSTVESYYIYDTHINTFKVYSDWVKTGDNYACSVEAYKIPSITLENAIEMFKNKNYRELRKKMDLCYVKTVTMNEKPSNDAMYEITYYVKDEDKFIYIQESSLEDAIESFAVLILLLFSGTATAKLEGNFNVFNYRIYKEELEREFNKETDVSLLKKKLEIKKSNYERLTR